MSTFIPDAKLRDTFSTFFVMLGVIDLSVAATSVHLILRHSPKSFGNYKWIQLTMTISKDALRFLVDLYGCGALRLSILYSDLCGAISSIIFIPRISGAIFVSKKDYGIKWSNLLLSLLSDGILLQFAAKVLAFYYRLFILLPSNQQRVYATVHCYGFVYLFTSIHVAPFAIYFSAPTNQSGLFNEKLAEFPELSDLRNVTETIVLYDYDWYLFLYMKYYLIVMASFFALAFIYALFVVYMYLYKSKVVSSKTRKMQVWLLKMLCVQCAVPLTVCVVPYWTIVAGFYSIPLYIQFVTQYANLICCTHSAINGVLVILLNKPYYDQFLLLFHCSLKLKPSTRTTSTVVNTTAARLFEASRTRLR